jgi:hypothetical protein
MEPYLILLPFFVVFTVVFFGGARRVSCPDCGSRLPMLIAPWKKTHRMWMAGGYLCPQCGCETNMAGVKVTADTPAAPFPWARVMVLAIALLSGVGLIGFETLLARPLARAAVAPPQRIPATAPLR